MNHKPLFLTILAVLALALTGCDRFPTIASAQATPTQVVPLVNDDGSVIAEGNVVPHDFSRIYTRAGGRVEEVLVAKGDAVEKDAVLVRMDGQAQAEAALAAAKLEEMNAQQALDDLNDKAQTGTSQAWNAKIAASNGLIEAQQALDDLDTDQYQTDLDNAKTDVSNARDDLDDAETEWDKYKDLDPDNQNYKNADTRLTDARKRYDDAVRERDRLINQMDQAKAGVAAAQAAFDDASREYDARASGPDPDDLALAQARLDAAKAQVAAAQSALDDLEIKAPFAGTVVEMDLVAGDTLLPSQQVAMIADFGQWYIETSDLTEMDVVQISEGQEAVIRPDALPELELPATVEEIARSSGKKGGDVTYTVRLLLDETDPALRWGMTVEVRFTK